MMMQLERSYEMPSDGEVLHTQTTLALISEVLGGTIPDGVEADSLESLASGRFAAWPDAFTSGRLTKLGTQTAHGERWSLQVGMPQVKLDESLSDGERYVTSELLRCLLWSRINTSKLERVTAYVAGGGEWRLPVADRQTLDDAWEGLKTELLGPYGVLASRKGELPGVSLNNVVAGMIYGSVTVCPDTEA